MADTLISPLGRSPGAVTGLYFALREYRDFDVQRVVTLGTSHPDVLTAAQRFIAPLLKSFGVMYDSIHLPIREFKGGEKAIRPYASMMGVVIDEAYQKGETVHISVTAGRSGMGALGALAAQFYGASYLWHFWVDEDIEMRGDVQDLWDLTGTDEMRQSKILNPTLAGENSWDLVALPFVQLRPLRPLLKEYARTGQLPDAGAMISAVLLSDMGISRKTLRDIYPPGITFQQADDFHNMATRYFQADSPEERDKLLLEIGSWMTEAGITDEEGRQRLLRVLHSNGSPAQLVNILNQKDHLGFGQFIKQHQGEIATMATLTEIFLKFLELFIRAKLGNSG